MGAWRQDRLADWPSVGMYLDLTYNGVEYIQWTLDIMTDNK
jgi:hypothetical protein